MDWRPPGSDRLQTSIVEPDLFHVADSRLDLWQRWSGTPEIFVFAIDEALIERIWQEDFRGTGQHHIATSIAVDDPVARRLINRARGELATTGPGSALIVESIASIFAVHLLRNYDASQRVPLLRKGGLAPGQMRRVIDYIDANLTHELGLIELAGIAGLSPHHFGEAFKTSMGIPPHRYIIERRVKLAAELLQDSRSSIADIALAAGFSSQSHLTVMFRQIMGTTPARFRRASR
jgi:AraC family transcriptional regulator